MPRSLSEVIYPTNVDEVVRQIEDVIEIGRYLTLDGERVTKQGKICLTPREFLFVLYNLQVVKSESFVTTIEKSGLGSTSYRIPNTNIGGLKVSEIPSYNIRRRLSLSLKDESKKKYGDHLSFLYYVYATDSSPSAHEDRMKKILNLNSSKA